ncbi:MAG: hypothetical protein R2932_45975 [Caldilineaceae bacterium]
MEEVERRHEPNPTVILARDNTQIGFSINGGDPTQDGAAIRVTDIHRIREELHAKGVETAIGESMSETAKNCKSSLLSHQMDFVIISTRSWCNADLKLFGRFTINAR